MNDNKITPLDLAPASGMRDLLPDETRLRDWAVSVILGTYSRFGFSRIETPALEHLSLLRSGEGGENLQLIFEVLKRGEKLDRALLATPVDKDELSDLGLRFDLTVPLVRYFCHNQDSLPYPLKAIQIGAVWRAERPQKGRFRQFTQCDIDVIGLKSDLAEIELLQASAEAVLALGLSEFTIRINDRELLAAIVDFCGFQKRPDTVFIAVDKLDKIGMEGVCQELRKLGHPDTAIAVLRKLLESLAAVSGPDAAEAGTSDPCLLADGLLAELSGLGLCRSLEPTDRSTETISPAPAASDSSAGGGGNLLALAVLEKLVPGQAACTQRLANIIRAVADLAEGRFCIEFDPTLVRGMGYYTGPIFEIACSGYSYSVGGGGRYDRMIGKFSGREVPACGFSIGFERIIGVLTDRQFQPPDTALNLALIFDADRDDARLVLRAARNLRQKGYAVSTLPRKKDMKKQLDGLVQQGYSHFCPFKGDPDSLEERELKR